MEDKFIELLNWRSIDRDEFCDACAGSGVGTYGGTSTWRGGIGGQMITADVCDECWGSGSRTKIWPSHKKISQTARERDALKAENEKLKKDLEDAVRIANGHDLCRRQFSCICGGLLTKWLSRFPVKP